MAEDKRETAVDYRKKYLQERLERLQIELQLLNVRANQIIQEMDVIKSELDKKEENTKSIS